MRFDIKEDLSPSSEYFEYEYFDWYDFNKVEKLNQKRSKQWLKLFVKLKGAKEKNDPKAMAKAREALKKHETLDKFLKQKASISGYYWV